MARCIQNGELNVPPLVTGKKVIPNENDTLAFVVNN